MVDRLARCRASAWVWALVPLGVVWRVAWRASAVRRPLERLLIVTAAALLAIGLAVRADRGRAAHGRATGRRIERRGTAAVARS